MNDVDCGNRIAVKEIDGQSKPYAGCRMFCKPVSILVYLKRTNRIVRGWENPFDADQVCYMDCGIVMTFIPRDGVKMFGGIGVYDAPESEATVFDSPAISNPERIIAESLYGGSLLFVR